MGTAEASQGSVSYRDTQREKYNQLMNNYEKNVRPQVQNMNLDIRK